MIWVFVFGGIALAGVIMLICYGVWLVHKASDLMAEAVVMLDRAGQIADLLAQIELPEELDPTEFDFVRPAPQPGRARPRARTMARGAPSSPYL